MAAPIFRNGVMNASQMAANAALEQLIDENAEALTKFTQQQIRNASQLAQSSKTVVNRVAEVAVEQVDLLADYGVFSDGGTEAREEAREGIERSNQRMRDSSDQCSTCLDASARVVNKKVVAEAAKIVSRAVVKTVVANAVTFC